MDILEELKERGLVFQTADEEVLVETLTKEQVSCYTGYDPTTGNLHLSHLVTILTSRRLQLARHKPCALVGGATGLIGDPSFKDAECSLQTKETADGWITKIQDQLSRSPDFGNDDNKTVMVNNCDWLGNVNFIGFLCDVGKYFTINVMMSKGSVRKHIETGVSCTEFAYQIMQGYDFCKLNDKYNVTLQIGGLGQWGNMTTGTELLRRKADKTGHVITVPLITDSAGKKFGKSEGDAVWLDADKASPYEMYQFWLNITDDDAVRFLKVFAFLSLEEITEIRKEFNAARHERLAQKILTREVVTLVHGEEAYKQALKITERLFAGDTRNLSAKRLGQGLDNVPNYAVQADDNRNIVEVLVAAKISPSKRQIHEGVQDGATYINGKRIQNLVYTLSDDDKIDNELIVTRRGKKRYFVLTY